MDILQTWQALIIPVLVVIISQLMKVVLESKKVGFIWGHLNSYGGMPSSHTAGFVSLMLISGLVEGFQSPLFAVTAFLTAVFIRDAVGIRWSLGFHGKVLNRLIHELPEQEQQRFPEKIQERLGHTTREVIAGALLGVVLTLLFYFAIN